ncbi:hypothetical protein P9112_012370 [Eukaryota sp. TZLM1-RC]
MSKLNHAGMIGLDQNTLDLKTLIEVFLFLGNNDEITKKLFEKLNSIFDKILSQLLGCRNAILECSERFADWEDLLTTTQSSTVFALNEEISKIDVQKWSRCFLQSFNGSIAEKNFLNLKFTLRTLQKRLTGMYENDFYNNIYSSAVLNQDLHSLLLEKGCS